MVIGLNHRTAPLAMRERFWISENRRYEVLQQLKSAEGIEEVVVLSTCCSPRVAETGSCRHQIGERT
jgi:glutamyl-tRNA reductase